MDSAVTSTVIKESDTAYVDVLDENVPNQWKWKEGREPILVEW
jgi:hypothetical protein